MDWRHEAACRDEDPELFFPIGNTGPALMQIEEAKAVCRRCSVVDTVGDRSWPVTFVSSASASHHARRASRGEPTSASGRLLRPARRGCVASTGRRPG